MKRLLIALLSLSLTAGCAISASAQVCKTDPILNTATTACGVWADCPNDGIPPRDGTGYQGGRNENLDNPSQGDASSDSVSEAACPNPDCPNPDCPNDGIPPRDGTGCHENSRYCHSSYQGRQNQQKQGNCYAKRTGSCSGNRTVCRYGA